MDGSRAPARSRADLGVGPRKNRTFFGAGGLKSPPGKHHALAIALTVAFILTPTLASAWSANGHRIVCEIAWNELTSRVKVHVRDILATDRHRKLFNESCDWPDEVRDQPRYEIDKARHYIDAKVDGTNLDRARDCSERCVVEGIEHYAGVLVKGGDGDRTALEALEFLGHFVGDIHQPLHAGFASDNGGNLLRLRPSERSHDLTTLHAFWDYDLVERLPGNWEEVAAKLEARITDTERALEGTKLDPWAWAEESHALARRIAYVRPEGGVASKEYVAERLPVVEQQLQLAGVRLGALLNQLLENDPTAALFMTDLPGRAHADAPKVDPPQPNAAVVDDP